jgi:hypothetical protein
MDVDQMRIPPKRGEHENPRDRNTYIRPPQRQARKTRSRYRSQTHIHQLHQYVDDTMLCLIVPGLPLHPPEVT